ncbi:hypothetical protein I553_6525 [Mycobacterium xenopi 4042]|uniref:Uncharacterized protein n=1 Tax=Mycobacterium xenopi 4042 TaxID=1299334 RepID=X8BHW8_MYCXE|nr:hypothetical protein I553_6525 [Mycobacterium xenopi 4042]
MRVHGGLLNQCSSSVRPKFGSAPARRGAWNDDAARSLQQG